MKNFLIALVATTLLVGCANHSKQEQGRVWGAITGIALGSMVGDGNGRTAAMVLGGIFGSAIGSDIGAQLDEKDRMLMTRSTQSALEYGRSNVSNRWSNPDSGHSGDTTPHPAYQNQGKHCREFTQTIYIGGNREVGKGKACRNNRGEWIIQ